MAKQKTIEPTEYRKVTYEIKDGVFNCKVCGHTSKDPNDIKFLYCFICKGFHKRIEAPGATVSVGQALAVGPGV